VLVWRFERVWARVQVGRVAEPAEEVVFNASPQPPVARSPGEVRPERAIA
jgi:hypothetical protein